MRPPVFRCWGVVADWYNTSCYIRIPGLLLHLPLPPVPPAGHYGTERWDAVWGTWGTRALGGEYAMPSPRQAPTSLIRRCGVRSNIFRAKTDE
jgi:hypothetical protein